MQVPRNAILLKAWRYEYFLLAVLMLGLTFTNLDRQVLGLSMQSLKRELHLSDGQLGFLTGISFAIFFSIMGFPLARLADRGDRVRLISVTTALCSVAVSLCGAAVTFGQLLLIRIGVAVGETGFVPTANSLIADYFPKAERARALSIYLFGGPLAVIISYIGGGWTIEYFGWRAAFFIMGAPGALVAALCWFGLREPRRNGFDRGGSRSQAEIFTETPVAPGDASLRQTIVTMLRSATFRELLYSNTLISFVEYGRQQWSAAFYMRSFGLDTSKTGTALAIVYGLSALFGLYLGGWIATRFVPNRERLQLRLVSAGYITGGVLYSLGAWTDSLQVALALGSLGSLVSYMTGGPFLAILQELVPPRMRAQATAFTFLVGNLIGMGMGPLVAGLLSDTLHSKYGDESLRYTLLVFCSGYFWIAWHCWRAGDSVRRDLAKVSDPEGRDAPELMRQARTKPQVL